MKLSIIAANLKRYHEQGKGSGRTYLYGDRQEITLLEHFIAIRTVANSDPEISFLEFFDYLKNLQLGHLFPQSDFIWGDTRASMTMVFNPWMQELPKEQKLNLISESSRCHQLRYANRSSIYRFFAATGTAIYESLPEGNYISSNHSWPTGMRF